MSDEREFGLFLFLLGVIFLYYSIKWIKKLRAEKYNPFKDNTSIAKPYTYFQSYGNFIFGILLILFSIFLIFS